MANVIFSSEQQRITGEPEAEVSALGYQQLVAELAGRYDGFNVQELKDMAIAIDGEIIQEPLLEAVGPHSEVHFIERIRGG